MGERRGRTRHGAPAGLITPDAMTVRRLTGAIAAEVSGVDLTQPLSEPTFAAVREAFLEHCVLVFRDQFLEAEAQRRFAHLWGEPVVLPYLSAHAVPGYTEILRVTNMGKEKALTEHWHTDSSFLPRPPSMTILAAQEIPLAGGDTMWANQYLAYERLSAGMRRLLQGLRGRFVGSLPKATGREEVASLHPLARTHPETGRTALYLGRPGEAVSNLEDMTEDESRPLLASLLEHATQPDLIYRHVWRPGDVVMWDNRCTLHYAVHDYGEEPRLLHRVTIEGDEPK